MKKSLFICACAVMLLPWQFVQAQEANDVIMMPEDVPADATDLEVIAEVDIYDAHIIEQKGHRFSIEMTLHNGKMVQPDIHYAAQLMGTDSEKGQFVKYQQIYDEVITLGEDASIHKSIVFDVPTYISGDYEIRVIARDSDELPLAGALLDTVTLYGDYAPYIDIKEPSCFLAIGGVDEQYSMEQGIDSAINEVLTVTCDVENYFLEEKSVQPMVVTYNRSLFGAKINTQYVPQAITFNAREKKTISFALPKQQKPQAYSVAISLVNGEKIDQSNIVYGHYVVQGESASISGVKLDKSSYAKDETIKASFIATSAADAYVGSRSGGTKVEELFYNMTIKDGQSGKDCIAAITHEKYDQTDITVNVERKSKIACTNPKVAVSIENASGKKLGENSFDLTPTAQEGNVVVNDDKLLSFGKIGWTIIITLTIIALLAIFGFKIREKLALSLAAFFIAGGIFCAVQDVQALTLRAAIDVDPGSYATCDFNLSGNTFNRGQQFTGYTSDCRIKFCGNKVNMNAHLNGQQTASWSLSSNWKKGSYNQSVSSRNITITAGNECKTYNVPARVWFQHYYNNIKTWREKTATGTLTYNVINCPKTFDYDLSAAASGCADGASRNATVNVSVSNVRGTAAGSAQFRYRCGSAAWSGWTTNTTSTCTFNTGGVKTISVEGLREGVSVNKNTSVTVPPCPVNGACNSAAAKVYTYAETSFVTPLCANGTTPVLPSGFTFPGPGQSVSWGCNGVNGGTNTSAIACSASRGTPPPVNGECGSTAMGEYGLDDVLFRGDLCTIGTPTITQSDFPDPGQTVTWGCSGINGGTNTSATACSATRVRPVPACGPDDDVRTDTRPTDPGLCATDCHVLGSVGINAGGSWAWVCEHDSAFALPRTIDCDAPSCLTNNPLTVQPSVYWPSEGNPQASVTVNCPNVCCIFKDTDVKDDPDEVVCQGESDKYIEIDSSRSYPAECYYKDDPTHTVTVNPTVQTMCTARSCNSQGTCQATPTPSNSRDGCTSTCNSDADCSRGRMIETRP